MTSEHRTEHPPAEPQGATAPGQPRGGPVRALPQTVSETDIGLYLAKLPEWGEHRGRHVLIYQGTVHGFFGTRTAALLEGFRLFGNVPFLVKEIDPGEKPRPIVGVIL